MLGQWSSSHCLEDHPVRSVQHEYRFPPIIQLDEVAPPQPSQKTLFSPVPSSSQPYDYWSSSEECDEVEDCEEEEEATESYCSSDPSCPGLGMENSERGSATASVPVEQKAKMSRVLAWRNSFDGVFAEDNAAALMSLKRKYLNEPENGEAEGKQGSSDAAPTSPISSSSKRSRTHSSSSSSSWSLPSPQSPLPPLPSGHIRMHICSACDASFPSLGELQHHSESDHEACRIAVQYGFE